MHILHSLIVLLFLAFCGILHSTPLYYLPQDQECSKVQITILLVTETYHWHVSSQPEKSLPFSQSMIIDKINTSLAPADYDSSVEVMLAKANDSLFNNIVFSAEVLEKPESFLSRCFHDQRKNAYIRLDGWKRLAFSDHPSRRRQRNAKSNEDAIWVPVGDASPCKTPCLAFCASNKVFFTF